MSETNSAKKMNKAQKKFATGAAIIVLAIAYLMYTGVNASSTYYYTIEEVLSMDPASQKKALRLEGKVKPGTIENAVDNLSVNFAVIDESMKSIPVFYDGTPPDMFQDDIDVVVEGRLGVNGKFVATRVLTSCPSRYDAAEEMKKDGKSS